MARILGVSWQHSHQTEHIRQGWAAVRGQERGQRSAMPQCLGRFQNPVLCCHSLITGSPQRSASMSTSSPRRTPSMLRRPRPGHPPVRSNLRFRLRRASGGRDPPCALVPLGVLLAPLQVLQRPRRSPLSCRSFHDPCHERPAWLCRSGDCRSTCAPLATALVEQ